MKSRPFSPLALLIIGPLAACSSTSSDLTATDTLGDLDTATAADVAADTADASADDDATSDDATADAPSDDTTATPAGIETCDDMAAFFVNAPDTVESATCQLSDGSSATCCTMTFGSDLKGDGPYCPESVTSPAPYGLSVYDGATDPGLRPFDGQYLMDIEADGYDPMMDEDGNTNINGGDGSACLAMPQDYDLTITVSIPLTPTLAASPTATATRTPPTSSPTASTTTTPTRPWPPTTRPA